MSLPEYDTRGGMILNRLSQFEKNKLEREQAKNALIKNKYAEPEIQANIQNKLMEAARNQALLQQPFAGRQIPGAGGEALGIEMLKQQYGEDSPVYQNAKRSYDLQQKGAGQLMDYRQSLMESQSKRSATPLAKMAMEQQDIDRGFMPGTTDGGRGQPISAETQRDLKNQYKQRMIKDLTDTKTRERALFATNMDKTINTLNPMDLTYYSGPKGQLQLRLDQAKSAAGETVPEYKKYKEALTSAKTLAKQVRQFYGDSITPSVQEGLNELTNPTNWSDNPEVAMARYNQFINILDTESDTFFNALHNASAYEKPKTAKEAIKKESEEFKNQSIKMVGPNGKVYNVPQGKAQLFIENGFKRS